MTIPCLPNQVSGVTSLLQLLSLSSTARPEATALRDAEHTLTFGELEVRSNQLAQFLQQQGARQGDVVAVIMPRSVSFAVAALAAMKAGAAYLPIDPEYPRERIAHILRDSGAAMVFSDRENLGRIPPSLGCSVVDFDFTGFSSYPRHAPDVRLEGSDLAYVIYTSGSTGQPKGVDLTHAGLLNLVRWHIGKFSIQPADRSSQVASVGFDAAVWELWPVLCAGASVLIPDALTRMAPERLRDWMVEEKITVAFAPTPIAELLIALPWPSGARLRYLLTGADVLKKFAPAGLPFQLVNNYGPTECTVVATSGQVPSTPESTGLPSIGTAIDGVQVYILDEKLRAVPPGVEGEICIGGAGLARGYRNHPELTAQRFVTYPSAQGPVRVYRTGDIGRVSERGEIEFRGRADEQIKIRGHRIELQEISLALNRYPGVRASAVSAVQNARGERELVAYVVADADSAESAWSAHLAKTLPQYMIPPVFMRLPELPLTAHGKLDRPALPAPPAATGSPAGFAAPGTLVEERMQQLASQLLGLPSVSVRDNLFLLGGHSLFGAQLIARVRNAFGIELPLRMVFEQPTVELLSRQIEVALVARLQNSGELSASASA